MKLSHACFTLFFPLCLFLAGVLMPIAVPGQLRSESGTSEAMRGTFAYDPRFATDTKPKLYCYTLKPANASCFTLDFRLTGNAPSVDFVRVYSGTDTSKVPLSTFGGRSHSVLANFSCPVMTVVFHRHEENNQVQWDLRWHAHLKEECARWMNPACAEFKPICGPSFYESGIPKVAADTRVEAAMPASCLNGDIQSWQYRFTTVEDGKLSFAIVPGSYLTDYDWMLWAGDPAAPKDCPDLKGERGLVACNFAFGQGMQGSTGMAAWGRGSNGAASDSPYAAPIEVKKGETYFLLVNQYGGEALSFSVEFNEVVESCNNRAAENISFYDVYAEIGEIDDHGFCESHFVEVVRLNEPENQPLMRSNALPALNWIPSGYKKSGFGTISPVASNGMIAALLNGMKQGKVVAWDPIICGREITFGDVTTMALRLSQGKTWDKPRTVDFKMELDSTVSDWWNPPAELFAPLGVMAEFIGSVQTDASGIRRQQIQFIRLLWVDATGAGRPFAVFQYKEVADLLDEVSVPNPVSDVQTLSLKDWLAMRQYKSEKSGHSTFSKFDTEENGGRLDGARPVDWFHY